MERKLWQGTLAQISAKDYFAVGAQAYFRDIQTRHEFSEYDNGWFDHFALSVFLDFCAFRTLWLGERNLSLW